MTRRVMRPTRRKTDDERRAFVLEHTKLAPVPLVPEVRLYWAESVTPVWFEVSRWLDDDDAAVPFWCVPWAGGQALARWVLDHPEVVRGARVLDFACGSGLVGLAATLAGGHVHAVDVDPLARVATELNAQANGLSLAVTTRDLVGEPLAGVDVLLAGDVWYEPKPSARFRRWFRKLASANKTVVTADSGRPHAPRLARELARYEVPTPFDLEAMTVRTARVLAM
ncbi:SAM-dependent methyltransferase [Labilithrix luteola]|uniref:SAM-dependent methyltransferase n=1 Tax=Labilithrix luteola TaxID=1391654 RepID=A0A0K1QDW1_9BACT|nr:50S ribosomal protein L11 methyltransferase [Labilithrix luteola]AKV03961.1 SAM-dependent methyltransferase [Labilithrix luteola]